MSLQMHLNKSGNGMASMTACGRNILRTPLSCNWDGFKLTPDSLKCAKCAASKQAEVNARSDANKWEPEDADAWMVADDALIAANKNRKNYA